MDMGWLDFVPQNKNFIIYDIESTLAPIDEQMSAKQYLLQKHELVSIGCTSFINNEYTTKYFVISESSEKARAKIVAQFLEFCVNELNRMYVDKEVEITCEQLKIEMGTKKWNDPERHRLGTQFYELQNIISLNILGYNSSHYDMQILLKYLVEAIAVQNVSMIIIYTTLES